MMPLLEFILGDLGHFFGAVILLCIIGTFLLEIVTRLRDPK